MKLEGIWEIENLFLLTNSLSLMLAGAIWGSAPFWLQLPSRKDGKGRPYERLAIFSFAGGKGKQVIQRWCTDLDYIWKTATRKWRKADLGF
jgi:hypothetical protein